MADDIYPWNGNFNDLAPDDQRAVAQLVVRGKAVTGTVDDLLARAADAPDRPFHHRRRLMPLVELARFPNGAEAELLRGRLESAGVHAVCFDAGMNIAESVGLLIPVRIMVLDEDLDEAQALIAEFDAGGNGTAT